MVVSTSVRGKFSGASHSSERSAELIHHGEKGAPVLKFVFKDLVPKVNRTGRANVKPKRCGPNLFLRTDLNSDLHDVVHEVAQLG